MSRIQRDLFGGALELVTQQQKDTAEEIRTRAFIVGKRVLRKLIGCSDHQAGSRMVRLVKLAKDDCQIVLQACEAAEDLQPMDAMAWLIKAVTIKANERAASARIGLDWDLIAPEDLDANAARIEAERASRERNQANDTGRPDAEAHRLLGQTTA